MTDRRNGLLGNACCPSSPRDPSRPSPGPGQCQSNEHSLTCFQVPHMGTAKEAVQIMGRHRDRPELSHAGPHAQRIPLPNNTSTALLAASAWLRACRMHSVNKSRATGRSRCD
ncbi:hypothetical protein CKAH01_11642 [Colletotrichum kahawae]|uniref:Uncharacterized protein n=1 Tax=Colletotrichum kahawae TaxID=34407 RepID=A0AAD9YT37_COLKA|nr:hypothetical protein CKAH01_11642 [Colletotrichum kahawae]